jgi:hypothetical protein
MDGEISMKDWIFYTGLGLLFTHELDAVPNREWRVFPFTSALTDDMGQFAFILAHVPLLAVLMALISSLNRTVRSKSRFYLCVFMAFHGLLHALFTNQESYEFDSVLSNILIFGSALCGATYAWMSRSEVRRAGSQG